MIITYSKSKDRSGEVANPETGRSNISLSPFAPENFTSRFGFSIQFPSRVGLFIFKLRLNLVLNRRIPPDFRGSVDLLI